MKYKVNEQEINIADLIGGSQVEDKFILTDSILYLNGEITSDMADDIIGYIVAANFPPPNEHMLDSITLMINSGGGCMHSSFAIISALRASAIPINTVAIGLCASGALMIAQSGTGVRLVDKFCAVMSHTLSTGFHDFAKPAELERWLADVQKSKNHIIDLYAENTKLSPDEIKEFLLPENGDSYLTAERAIRFNLFDDYFTSYSQIKYTEPYVLAD